jgi:hypothetical protein
MYPCLSSLSQFTVSAYETRTSGTCLPLSFEDITEGKLPLPEHTSSKKYDLVICSFALHLVGDHSEMFSLLYALSQRAKWMLVLAPHKKPEVSSHSFGFQVVAILICRFPTNRLKRAGAGSTGIFRRGKTAGRSSTMVRNRLTTRTPRKCRIQRRAISIGTADWRW